MSLQTDREEGGAVPRTEAETDGPVGPAGWIAASAEYGRTLRTWLVAYGVGGPLLFLTQKDVAEAIRASGEARFLVYLFLAGVALQIFLAVFNKWLTWFVGAALLRPRHTWGRLHRLALRLNQQVWIDILCDVGAVACFGWATVRALLLFT